MKNIIKKSVNSVLNPVGLTLVQNKVLKQSNHGLVMDREVVKLLEQVESAVRSHDLPDLPPRKGRHEIMVKGYNLKIQAFYLAYYLNKTLKVPGAVCEFGVSHGASSALFANEIMETDKHLWLFDSFEGLPKPTEKDVLIDDIAGLGSMEKYQGEMCQPRDRVEGRLRELGFPEARTHIVPGFIEKTSTSAKLPDQVAFAYVDFDFYEPILIGLTLLAPRLHPKGIILVDDYGFFSAGAQTAVDEFVADQKGRFKLTLPPAYAGKFAILTQNN